MVWEEIIFYRILGLPLIAYGGMITLGLAVATAYTGWKNKPLKVHKTLAGLTVLLGVIHGALGLLAYL